MPQDVHVQRCYCPHCHMATPKVSLRCSYCLKAMDNSVGLHCQAKVPIYTRPNLWGKPSQ